MVKPAGNVAPLPCVVMWATLRHFLVWRAENLESWRDSAVVWYGACPLVGCLGGFLVDTLLGTKADRPIPSYEGMLRNMPPVQV